MPRAFARKITTSAVTRSDWSLETVAGEQGGSQLQHVQATAVHLSNQLFLKLWYIYIDIYLQYKYLYVYIYIWYVYICAYMYVCMYVCIYIYIYICWYMYIVISFLKIGLQQMVPRFFALARKRNLKNCQRRPATDLATRDGPICWFLWEQSMSSGPTNLAYVYIIIHIVKYIVV